MLDYETTVAQVKARRDAEEDFTLLDVREPWEIATSSISGTVNIPMGELPARANNELDPEAEIVVICHHGARSLNVTAWLRQQGFERAQSMAGGIEQWSREIDSAIPRY
jgi:rhodanese-related sulfurtransferase